MYSAFGIDHGEISKSLKPRHIHGLMSAASDDSLGNWRHAQYARDRLNLHGIKDIAKKPEVAQRMTISRGMYKKSMGRLVRVRDGRRAQNRKAVLGDKT